MNSHNDPNIHPGNTKRNVNSCYFSIIIKDDSNGHVGRHIVHLSLLTFRAKNSIIAIDYDTYLSFVDNNSKAKKKHIIKKVWCAETWDDLAGAIELLNPKQKNKLTCFDLIKTKHI